MNKELRNGLWSAIDTTIFSSWINCRGAYINLAPQSVQNILGEIWMVFFKYPSDSAGEDGGFETTRGYFFRCPWNKVYDLVEFFLNHVTRFKDALAREVNVVLIRENAGYRIIGEEIVPITNSGEIETVQAAYQSGLSGVDIHIKRAVELLSDRQTPDYRNAIKEAVSAVESACRVVSGDEKATLGQALKRVGEKSAIHPAMEKALSALYGYTSDEGGIRHSLLEVSTVTFTDAKFMVIACSAFVNYLACKMSDIDLKK